MRDEVRVPQRQQRLQGVGHPLHLGIVDKAADENLEGHVLAGAGIAAAEDHARAAAGQN